jgi:RNA polymerase sigma-70 factor (ECF subfamily)
MEEPSSTRPQAGNGDNELVHLMIAYQNGEMPAFEALYKRLAPMLRGYLSSLTWSRDRAEDLLQETFLQLHRARHTYIPRRPVRPWVFAIARHCHLMDLRTFARKRSAETFSEDGQIEIPVPAEMNGFADRELVRQGMHELPADQREAVVLHYVWGFSYSEIGGILGIGAGAAKLRAFRGIERLRDTVGRGASHVERSS